MKEGKKSVLEGVPKSLPAIVKSFRIQEKEISDHNYLLWDTHSKMQNELILRGLKMYHLNEEHHKKGNTN